MPHIYKISRSGLNLIYKIRHHRGHGIHSPFVFNLINKVVEEKLPYYDFNDIKEYIDMKLESKTRISKINKLSFRLINYFDARTILEIGAGRGINSLFLTAPNKNIVCHCIETDMKKRSKASMLYNGWKNSIKLYPDDNLDFPENIDCIYINLKNYKSSNKSLTHVFNNHLHEKSFIIVEGIRTNKRNKTQWEAIRNLNNRSVILDLFNIGIVFFDPTLYRWDYTISF